MRRFLILMGVVLLVGLVVGGGCSYSALETARRIINGQFTVNNLSYRTFGWCTNGLPLVDKLERMLNRTYIVLLQNNTELRATGGFAGSYARVRFEKKGLDDVFIQDIYQPDGKLPGHVEPPYPIQESFRQGWWKLRDANWDPDFASAAATVAWFFEQGGEERVDGVVAVNLDFLEGWLRVLGPIKLNTFEEMVTAGNLYTLAQRYAETRVEGNKTEKREFLGAVGAALLERIKSAGLRQLIQLASLTVGELNSKQVLVWVKDQEVQKDVMRMRWDGGLMTGWDKSGDYLYVVDSNLGANKADCCVDREMRQEIEKGSPDKEKITLYWRNRNEFAGAKPPVFWGGDYIDYARVVVPKEAMKIVTVTVNGKQLRQATEEDFLIPNSTRQGRSEEMYVVESRQDLQIIGFWAVVPAGQEKTAVIELESGRNIPSEYKVWVKRQPGIEALGYELLVNGQIRIHEDIDRDRSFVVKI
jgi:hypothetical protein